MDSCLPSFEFACTANSESTYASEMDGYERREYISWTESSERVCRDVEMTAWHAYREGCYGRRCPCRSRADDAEADGGRLLASAASQA